MAVRGYIVGAPAGITPKDFDDSIVPGDDPEHDFFLPAEDIDGEPGDGYFMNSEYNEWLAEQGGNPDDDEGEGCDSDLIDEILAGVYGFTAGEVARTRGLYDELRERGYGDGVACNAAIGIVLEARKTNAAFDHYDYADPSLTTEKHEAVFVPYGSFARETMSRRHRHHWEQRNHGSQKTKTTKRVEKIAMGYRWLPHKHFEDGDFSCWIKETRTIYSSDSHGVRGRKPHHRFQQRETIRRARVRADIAVVMFRDDDGEHSFRSYQFCGLVAEPRATR